MKVNNAHARIERVMEAQQEELGRLVVECMKVMGNLSVLHHQDTHLWEEKMRIANNLGRGGTGFDRFDLEMRMRCGLNSTDGEAWRGPSSTSSRRFRSLGAAFDHKPSLLEDPFTSLWSRTAHPSSPPSGYES